MSDGQLLVRVAVPVPLADGFDYLWPVDGPRPAPGCRVRVPFGRKERIGIVLTHPDSTTLSPDKLRPVLHLLDERPVIAEELLRTLLWASEYYHHPIGEVLKHALPTLLRKGRSLADSNERAWRLTSLGESVAIGSLHARAKQQLRIVTMLRHAGCVSDAEIKRAGCTADALRRVLAKGWIAPCTLAPESLSDTMSGSEISLPQLTADQLRAIESIEPCRDRFGAFLLHGATGSGKTEVFLRLIGDELREQRQTLLLVPEIGLTPQLIDRLKRRFGNQLAVIHSALTDRDRFDAWNKAYEKKANVIVGTRSAVFAPLPAAGLIIVDEEHDTSYKQQQGFRYSARDLAVVRARRLDVPVLLASATPSLESYRNGLKKRYRVLTMPKRIGPAGKPKIRVIDLNRHAARQGLSTPLIASITEHLDRGNQVLLFLNRRGFAPVLFCPQCREAQECDRCDARMTVHARSGELRCHHCGAHKPLHWACAQCGTERIGVGAGTQRIAETLHMLYPDRRIARLDRDITARAGALTSVLDDVQSGETEILVGTQMLTKGHDFPRVTLVGVLNADQGLFGTDFRSDERLAQTIVQVAGRAGRRSSPGEVVIQTHYPQHPLLTCLLTHDYAAFAELALRERELAQWPPYSYLALWRAEATQRKHVFDFLDRVRADAAESSTGVSILGPAADSMERRGGRFRGQLLFQSTVRSALHERVTRSLVTLREWREARRVRWSLDVDPIEL